MSIIHQELGKRLTVKEVATLFGVDARFVRQHYDELGGMRLGNRIYVFFEREVVNAIQGHIKRSMDRASEGKRKEEKTQVPDKKRSVGMGGNAKIKGAICTRDPYNLTP